MNDPIAVRTTFQIRTRDKGHILSVAFDEDGYAYIEDSDNKQLDPKGLACVLRAAASEIDAIVERGL